MSILNTAQVIAALQAEPMTLAELQGKVKLSKNTVLRLVATLRDAGYVEFKQLAATPAQGGVAPAVYGWKSKPANRGWVGGVMQDGGVGPARS